MINKQTNISTHKFKKNKEFPKEENWKWNNTTIEMFVSITIKIKLLLFIIFLIVFKTALSVRPYTFTKVKLMGSECPECVVFSVFKISHQEIYI